MMSSWHWAVGVGRGGAKLKMSTNSILDRSEATATMLLSRWGTNNPGLDMTGVYLRVLEGRPFWLIVFYQLMAAKNRRACGGAAARANYMPNLLFPRMGGRGSTRCVV